MLIYFCVYMRPQEHNGTDHKNIMGHTTIQISTYENEKKKKGCVLAHKTHQQEQQIILRENNIKAIIV